MGTRLPLRLLWHLPPHHALTAAQSQEGSSKQLQGNGACTTEVTSQVSRLEKCCLNWSLCKHSVLIMHQNKSPLTPINLGSL